MFMNYCTNDTEKSKQFVNLFNNNILPLIIDNSVTKDSWQKNMWTMCKSIMKYVDIRTAYCLSIIIL